MQRALDLARGALGATSPNPSVGAVVVKGDQIVGEGFTQPPPGDHAEIVALKQAGESARGAARRQAGIDQLSQVGTQVGHPGLMHRPAAPRQEAREILQIVGVGLAGVGRGAALGGEHFEKAFDVTAI